MQPALSVLYLEDGGRSNGGDAGDAAALQTPFSLDEFQEAVAAALARR
ncbi:MAG TPA: hypothetical protein VJU01_01085 [Gaiellaceae bacterium]|nr:hypothetical protein [Gaiellaceae bacterium]